MATAFERQEMARLDFALSRHIERSWQPEGEFCDRLPRPAVTAEDAFLLDLIGMGAQLFVYEAIRQGDNDEHPPAYDVLDIKRVGKGDERLYTIQTVCGDLAYTPDARIELKFTTATERVMWAEWLRITRLLMAEIDKRRDLEAIMECHEKGHNDFVEDADPNDANNLGIVMVCYCCGRRREPTTDEQERIAAARQQPGEPTAF
jgi:hypothetical protein